MGLNLSAFVLIPFKSGFIHPLCSWEYPNRQGIGCNLISANDSANFLSFLQTLRNQTGAQDLIISAAVSIVPFVGPDGNPMTDVSEFAMVLDYIGSLIQPPLTLCPFDLSHSVQRL